MTRDPLVDPDRTYTRAVEVQTVDVDKHTVEVKIVPYEVPADIGEGVREVFTRGAFAAAVGNPGRCKMTDQQHNRSVVVAKATELRDETDGLYGVFQLADTAAGRDVFTLLREEILDEMSVEFKPLRRGYDIIRAGPEDILIRHNKALLLGVSPVGSGAYGSDARVVAVRSAELERAREKALAFLHGLTSGPPRA